MNKRICQIGLLMGMIVAVALSGKERIQNVLADGKQKECTVVLDAGHGGEDPGKVGINGCLEKDVNLSITLFVKDYLIQNGVKVIQTRTEDKNLCQEGGKYRKLEDLKNRLAIIDSADAALAVSVHQNSYTDARVTGCQVFYYKGSQPGEQIAGILQETLSDGLKEKRARKEKANDSYYLLKKSKTPTVIVECGFLSNADEAQKLMDVNYQKKVAWYIAMGILKALNERKGQPTGTFDQTDDTIKKIVQYRQNMLY